MSSLVTLVEDGHCNTMVGVKAYLLVGLPTITEGFIAKK